MENKLLPVCVICNGTPPGGISAGIFINRRFICSNCEQAIVGVGIGSKKYYSIVSGLRKIWL